MEAGLHTVSVSQVTVNIDGIGLAFDATLAVGAQRARDVSRAHDMPVRVVDEEVLLIEGSHTACCWRKFSLRLPLALLAGRRVVDTQLWIGGPVRDMLMLSGGLR